MIIYLSGNTFDAQIQYQTRQFLKYIKAFEESNLTLHLKFCQKNIPRDNVLRKLVLQFSRESIMAIESHTKREVGKNSILIDNSELQRDER